VSVDVVVVGLGGVGSAAAAVLARRGLRVLGLDGQPSVHDQGASHGETRIVRTACFEGAAYVPLLRRAYELWDELGLLRRTGRLFLGEPGSQVLEGGVATARAFDLPHEQLDAAEVARRFPLCGRRPARPRCTSARPAGCRRRPRSPRSSRAGAAGAELRHDEPVPSCRAGPDGARVTTSPGRGS
jgi:sarcosine oxidase